MYTYYLKFSYQKTMYNTLFDTQSDADGNETQTPKYDGVDVIGRIYKVVGTSINSNGDVEPIKEMQTGFYANVRHLSSCPELEQYEVFPQTPERIWA